MTQNVQIAPLQDSDYEDWLPLWIENNQGHNNEEITDVTWQRLITPESPVYGLAAWDGNKMAGILHYILHPVTGHIKPVAYMQDLFVTPDCRRQGIARQMVMELVKIGQNEQWPRIYWLAEADNKAAQALYKNLGVKLNFTFHVMPTS